MKMLNRHLSLLPIRKRENTAQFFFVTSLFVVALMLHSPALAEELNESGGTTYDAGTSQGNAAVREPTEYSGKDSISEQGEMVKADSPSHGDGVKTEFNFSKIGSSGNVLTEDDATPFCVKDNVTGLTWEGKSDDGGLNDKDWTYSWYNSSGVNDGGGAGTAAGGACGGTIEAGCDTEKFVAAVNASGLCGAKDWRLPSHEELLTIVDNNRNNPAIDSKYFPNTIPAFFWTSSPYAVGKGRVWCVSFINGHVYHSFKHPNYAVRLVRGGH